MFHSVSQITFNRPALPITGDFHGTRLRRLRYLPWPIDGLERGQDAARAYFSQF